MYNSNKWACPRFYDNFSVKFLLSIAFATLYLPFYVQMCMLVLFCSFYFKFASRFACVLSRVITSEETKNSEERGRDFRGILSPRLEHPIASWVLSLARGR
jgi:hypothetical protein